MSSDPRAGQAAGRAAPDVRRTLNAAWTGHRPEYFADPDAVAGRILELASALRAEHGAALVFHCGGQRGVDTWAAAAAERLKIALHLYLPLPVARFAQGWSAPDLAALMWSYAYAAERVVVDPDGALGAAAYSRRNWLLAERADLLVAVWTGLGGGGTAETIAAAKQLGRMVQEHRVAASDRAPRAGERGV